MEQSDYVKKIKKYIIHIPECFTRKDLVNDILKVTGANIFDAIRASDGALGCYLSHLEIYKKDPEESVIVFEDDCIIHDKNMLSLLDDKKHYDIVFFGVNRLIRNAICEEEAKNLPEGALFNSFGTHAMWVSLKAKKVFLEYVMDKAYCLPVDTLWNKLQNDFKLSVWRPAEKDVYKYCEQKTGEKSTITGNMRLYYHTKISWQERKCRKDTCNYKVHPDQRNNHGTHCCLGCKRGEAHGINCLHVVWVEQ